MEVIIISLVALVASILTFFSGFGLGTILTPVMMIWFPAEVAIALTAVVHLCNNIFKLLLTGRNANLSVLFRFGVTAILFSILGSLIMVNMIEADPIAQYSIGDRAFMITVLKLIVGFLLIVFVLLEFIPSIQNLKFQKLYLPIGGAISGFFGGLTGHQGALRSAFLMKAGLSKEAFIATTVVVSTFVDFSRLGIYTTSVSFKGLQGHEWLIVSAILAAVAGAFLGNRLLKKVTITQLKVIVGIMLLVFGMGLMSGLI